MTEISRYVLEVLRAGPEFALYRGRQPGNALTILVLTSRAEQSSPANLSQLEHEYSLADQLDSQWAVRPLGITRHEGRATLTLEDPGGVSLEDLLGRPLDLPVFLRIAVALAATIGQVHRRGLIHKDIKPGNVLIDDAGNVRLTGFGMASRLPRERQAPATPELIPGTLAYMAPEQTGRMNRSIDARSDLYSLGVTLYEMLTGALPFTASDPMEWIHCHIARKPRPPSERVSGLAAPVEAIILKLLAKNSEDRYQTAAGIEADLQLCLTAWQAHGHIDAFPLGAHDTSDRLLIPEKLWGRQGEIAALSAALDRVITQGRTEVVLVSGHAGIGKSSLVNELQKFLVPSRCLFAAGKYDPGKRDIPYAALAQALQSLMRPLLTKQDRELAHWRVSFLEALGPNGQLMVNLIPELSLIIGEQPPLAALPPQDGQNRFRRVFHRFLGVFAQAEHPLVLFLDDLQWLDATTLQLLESLLTESESHHLLLVGAYRDNEVGPLHPLEQMLGVIRDANVKVQDIRPGPLQLDDVARLLDETLHAGVPGVQPLADLLIEKTGGNPFFLIQFLTTLTEEALLAFDADRCAWQWDVDRIRSKGITDNVADLVATRLSRLPATTQVALGQLACLGNIAEIAVLTVVCRGSEGEIDATLREAVRAGLVLRFNASYSFTHDRVREAAYALISEDVRAAMHLQIGRALAARTAPTDVEERIFEIVDQFNRGAILIESPEERTQVAEFNLMAAERAKVATAYASALTYLAAGRALLTVDGWEHQFRLTFDLEMHQAECEFLTGASKRAEARLQMLWRRGTDPLDLARVVWVAAALYTTVGPIERAIEICLEYLKRMDMAWTPHPTDEEIQRECQHMWTRIADRPINALVDLPLMTDQSCRATMDVLAALLPVAHILNHNLAALVAFRMTNLSLAYGNCDASAYAYSELNMILGPRLPDYQSGFEFGKVGLRLVEARGLDRFKARVYSAVAVIALPWTRPLDESLVMIRRALEAALEVGDLPYAAWSHSMVVAYRFACGEPLADVQREAELAQELARKARWEFVIAITRVQLKLIYTLRGLTPDYGTFNDAQFDEPRFEQRLSGDPPMLFAACWYRIRKLQAHFFSEDFVLAAEAAEKTEGLLAASRATFELAEYHFYGALAQAAHGRTASEDERPALLGTLTARYKQLALWAQGCPETFANRVALVGAEIARLEGRDIDAERLYEEAIRSARECKFIQNEAVANELAARFYEDRGFETIANTYLSNAQHCYLRWGAEGKVRQLSQRHPKLPPIATSLMSTGTLGAPVAQLDVGTMIKASQALSSEIVLGSLIETLMRISIEHAGAERGILILLRNGEAQIAAEAGTVGWGTVEITRRDEVLTAIDLPESALHYVTRTRESLILNDASVSPLLSGDVYVQQRRPKSVLCTPIIKQGKLVGALYLENNLTPNAFTPDRTTVLEVLAAQAAISLENAYLYSDLQRSEAFLAEGQRMTRTGTWYWNVSTGAMAWSDEQYHIFDRDPREDPAPTFEWFLERVHPEDRARIRQKVESAIGVGERFDSDFRINRSDGTVRHLQSVGRPVTAKSEDTIEYIGTTMDVTERQNREEALRDAQADLVNVTRVTTMGELTGSIAHEVNQPLAAIVCNAASCQLWLEKEPPNLERVRKCVDRIVRDGHHAGDVIRSIRDMVRKSSPEMTPLDINGVIEDVLELMGGEVRRHRISLEVELGDGLAQVVGDRVQLQQVIVNLVKNGIEAMSAVMDRPRTLRVSASRDGANKVLVAVEDSGVGLDSTNVNRIFEPRFTTKPEGMGLGLSICRSIIEAHGGLLQALPVSPKGSLFRFTLPAWSSDADVMEPSSKQDGFSGQSP